MESGSRARVVDRHRGFQISTTYWGQKTQFLHHLSGPFESLPRMYLHHQRAPILHNLVQYPQICPQAGLNDHRTA